MRTCRARYRPAAIAVLAVLSMIAALTAVLSGAGRAPAASPAPPSATLNGDLDPLGINTAAWDGYFTDPAVADQLSSARMGLVRYPGGSWADTYDWQTNTDAGATQSLDFADFSTQVDAVSEGQKFVTVNYGSGTAASAGAWATQAKTAGQHVALWEVGNEEYGSWETDDHSDPHTASSYASNALAYMKAIKSADPDARVCYDYGMDGSLAPGAGANDWKNWNDTILAADAAEIDCADVHWYPINGTPSETPQSIMATLDNVPTAAQEIKTALTTYDPSADFVVGETSISNAANGWVQQPVGALFSAANALAWLANGAQSVDWWDAHNYGSPGADLGMFSSATNGEPAVDTPYAPYYGYQLASELAVKGATVSTLDLGTQDLYAYDAQLPDGSYGVLLANADTSASRTVSTADLGIIGGSLTQKTYDAANPTIVSSAPSGSSVTLPAESVVLLTGAQGAPPSGGPTSPPTTTPPTTGPPTTTPPAGNGSCTASWSVVNSWPGGFQLGITVSNPGTSATKDWSVGFTWPDGQTASQVWGATSTGSGASASFGSLSYDGAIDPGGTATFGLIGSGSPPSSLGDLGCTAD